MPAIDLDALRRYAVARSLFAPTSLPRAIERLRFVQADPIRAPARAQDLTLRHRVHDYRAGDLERRYPRLAIEEDFLVNYGFMPRALHALMHPRAPRRRMGRAESRRAAEVLAFVRARGQVHPRDVDAQFDHGRVRNWFGGSSNASTQLLDAMHYRGWLRIARRDSGVRIYAPREPTPGPADARERDARHDALVDALVAAYAPLPLSSLGQLLSHLQGGVPQWRSQRAAARCRARARLPSARVDGVEWYWPEGENPASRRHAAPDAVRLLAPFDPVVWDRRRFELLWGWAYRFEAYTPPARRRLGYYALPLLWRDAVIGWANVSQRGAALDIRCGYVAGRAPRERAFRDALDAERARLASFLAPRGSGDG